MSLAAPTNGANTIEDSLRNGHEAAQRARNLLDAIWTDLTGNEACDPERPPGCGLIDSADDLATRIAIIANRLEDIRCRIVSPKVVGIGQAQNNLQNNYAAKGYGG